MGSGGSGFSGAEVAAGVAARRGAEAAAARALVRPRSSREETLRKNCLSLNRIISEPRKFEAPSLKKTWVHRNFTDLAKGFLPDLSLDSSA